MTRESIAEKFLGYPGRLIAASKGRYSHHHPRNLTAFNSHIRTADGEEIWYGDIDVTVSHKELMHLAAELRKDISVFYESGKTPMCTISKYGVFTFSDGIAPHIDYVELQAPMLNKEKDVKPVLVDHTQFPKPGDCDDSNIIAVFDMPEIVMTSRKRVRIEDAPLFKFQRALKKKLDAAGITDISISDVIVSGRTANALEAQTFTFLGDHADALFNGDSYELEKHQAQLWFFAGPSHVNEKWCEDGKVYIRESKNIKY